MSKQPPSSKAQEVSSQAVSHARRDDDATKGSFKLSVIEAANADPKLSLPVRGKAKKRQGMAGKSALAVLCARLTQLDWPSRHSFMSREIISAKTDNMATSTITEADKRLVAAGYLKATGEADKSVPIYEVCNPRPEDIRDHIEVLKEFKLQKEAERKQDWRKRKAKLSNVPPSTEGTEIKCPTKYRRDKTPMSHRPSMGCPTEYQTDIPHIPSMGREEVKATPSAANQKGQREGERGIPTIDHDTLEEISDSIGFVSIHEAAQAMSAHLRSQRGVEATTVESISPKQKATEDFMRLASQPHLLSQRLHRP